jgi:hypothetical protein
MCEGLSFLIFFDTNESNLSLQEKLVQPNTKPEPKGRKRKRQASQKQRKETKGPQQRREPRRAQVQRPQSPINQRSKPETQADEQPKVGSPISEQGLKTVVYRRPFGWGKWDQKPSSFNGGC